jgi:hypothetical protein
MRQSAADLRFMRRNTDADFWKRVDRSGGPNACHPWTGRCKPPSNGMQFGHGCYDHDGTWDYASRYAFKLTKGEPVGFVCHTCDFPPCCNPAHLYDGDAGTNARDCATRGRRNVQGERNPRAKLTDAQVVAIRAEPRILGYRQRLAALYGVKPSTISAVVGGVNFKHL